MTDVPTKLGPQRPYHILIRRNRKAQPVPFARRPCQRRCRPRRDPIVQRPKQPFCTWARQHAETATRKPHSKAPRYSLNSTGAEAPAVGTAAACFLTSFLRRPNEEGVPCLWCCKARLMLMRCSHRQNHWWRNVYLHSLKLTWPLKIGPPKRKIHLPTTNFRKVLY